MASGGARRCAIAAASRLFGASSFLRMCETWTPAVFTLMTSASAISRFVWPRATRVRTSSSRGTIAVTDFVHFHDGRIVVRSERTITTSDGSVGHGTASLIDNGQVIRFRMTDIMTNASGGYHFRARAVFVLDVSTGTVRVERFELTCLGP
jgi:hypothetical protein